MSKGQTLRALVNERLAAAAEDIFVLFERTIVEYEEELCRSREENQRKQQLLDTVLIQTMGPVRVNVQVPSASPGLGLNQDVPESPRVKEEPKEQNVKQEEEQQPMPVPESSGVCVKTEESSLLQQRQTELREKPEYISSETEGHTDNDDDWGDLLSYSAAQMETEADGDHYNQVQIRDRSSTLSSQNQSAPQTSVHSGVRPQARRKKHPCLICNKIFRSNKDLERHFRVHTGERPFSCPVCMKSFSQKGNLDLHMRKHTGEKPYSCSICQKQFRYNSAMKKHRELHTEKPYSCELCRHAFATEDHLEEHRRRHAGQRPHRCSTCSKTFALKRALCLHEAKVHNRVLSQHT